MELQLNFVCCLLCDENFCPVALSTESEDEKLLDIFCKYFDLTPSQVDTFYDEQLGFPFCDSCREDTLINLNRLHEKLTSIQAELSQLVSSVTVAMGNLTKDQDLQNDDDSDERFTTSVVYKIRKYICNRNQQTQTKSIDASTQTDQFLDKDDQIFPGSFSPENEVPATIINYPSSRIPISRPRRRPRPQYEISSDYPDEIDPEYSSPKPRKPRKPPVKILVIEQSQEKVGTRKKNQKYEEPQVAHESSLVTFDLNNEDGQEDDDNGSSDGSESADQFHPAPQYTIVKRGSRIYTAEYDRRINDPIVEVQPNLFRRSKTGWSFRRNPPCAEYQNRESYTCLAAECVKVHLNYSEMVKHITTCHINEWERCTACFKSYRNKQLLDAHDCRPKIRKYKNKRVSEDGQWTYEDREGRLWPYHEIDKLAHFGFTHECGTCGFKARAPHKMGSHILRQHAEAQLCICEICERTFNSPYALKKHLNSHSDAKDCICDFCGMAFKTESTVRAHIERIHELEKKSFKCDWPGCDRGFSHPYGLNRHRKSAGHPKTTSEESTPLIDPIICGLCGAEFVKERTHNHHREKCVGKKKHPCPLCDHKGQTRSALRVHMRKMHKDEWMNYPEGHHVKPRPLTMTTTLESLNLKLHLDTKENSQQPHFELI